MDTVVKNVKPKAAKRALERDIRRESPNPLHSQAAVRANAKSITIRFASCGVPEMTIGWLKETIAASRAALAANT
jgi:hypothetical protein